MPGTQPTVFIVEADDVLRQLVCEELRRRQFRILAVAASVEEAEACIRRLGSRKIDLVVIASHLGKDHSDGEHVASAIELADMQVETIVCWTNAPQMLPDWTQLIVYKCDAREQSVQALVDALVVHQSPEYAFASAQEEEPEDPVIACGQYFAYRDGF